MFPSRTSAINPIHKRSEVRNTQLFRRHQNSKVSKRERGNVEVKNRLDTLRNSRVEPGSEVDSRLRGIGFLTSQVSINV